MRVRPRREDLVDKLDLRTQLKSLYSAPTKIPTLIDVPAMTYAMVDGVVPMGVSVSDSEEFQQAIGTLYGVSYTLKFMSKSDASRPIDYPVMPLEALWWSGEGLLDLTRRTPLSWRAMILQPAHITPAMFRLAVRQAKQRGENPALDRVRLRSFREGLCLQIMHIGPYSEEGATIDRLMTYAKKSGYRVRGKHHEIYLGDPRRASPERLKTILRYPVSRRR